MSESFRLKLTRITLGLFALNLYFLYWDIHHPLKAQKVLGECFAVIGKLGSLASAIQTDKIQGSLRGSSYIYAEPILTQIPPAPALWVRVKDTVSVVKLPEIFVFQSLKLSPGRQPFLARGPPQA